MALTRGVVWEATPSMKDMVHNATTPRLVEYFMSELVCTAEGVGHRPYLGLVWKEVASRGDRTVFAAQVANECVTEGLTWDPDNPFAASYDD